MINQHDDTSDALLRAARQLLAERGPAALTVRNIATAADMSTMNVYSRFGGKDGVIDELYLDGFRRLIDTLAAVPVTDRPIDDLIALAHAYRTFSLENPRYYAIMFRTAIQGYAPSPATSEHALGALDLIAPRVAEAQRAGALISDDRHDAVTVSALLWATCHGLISLELTEVGLERVDWAELFELTVSATIGGLRPQTSADRS